MFHSGRGRNRTCVSNHRAVSHIPLRNYAFNHTLTISRPNVRRAELERRVFTRSVLYCLLYISTSRLKPHGESVWLSRWSQCLSAPAPIVSCFSPSSNRLFFDRFTVSHSYLLLSSPCFMYRGTYILRYNLYFKYLFICYYWYITVLLSCTTINTGVVT